MQLQRNKKFMLIKVNTILFRIQLEVVVVGHAACSGWLANLLYLRPCMATLDVGAKLCEQG